MQTALLLSCHGPSSVDAALASGVDALVFDLDGPSQTRPARRKVALAGLPRVAIPEVASRRIVRVAALGSGDIDEDLDAVMRGAPDAVWLPGAVGGRALQHLAAKLAWREAENGVLVGRTRIIATPADTAAGVLALPTLADASHRLAALVWDASALAAALGVGLDASPVRAARDLLLFAAAVAGVPALDSGRAEDDLTAACHEARRDGFSGRFARRSEEVGTIASSFQSAVTDRGSQDAARTSDSSSRGQ